MSNTENTENTVKLTLNQLKSKNWKHTTTVEFDGDEKYYYNDFGERVHEPATGWAKIISESDDGLRVEFQVGFIYDPDFEIDPDQDPVEPLVANFTVENNGVEYAGIDLEDVLPNEFFKPDWEKAIADFSIELDGHWHDDFRGTIDEALAYSEKVQDEVDQELLDEIARREANNEPTGDLKNQFENYNCVWPRFNFGSIVMR